MKILPMKILALSGLDALAVGVAISQQLSPELDDVNVDTTDKSLVGSVDTDRLLSPATRARYKMII